MNTTVSYSAVQRKHKSYFFTALTAVFAVVLSTFGFAAPASAIPPSYTITADKASLVEGESVALTTDAPAQNLFAIFVGETLLATGPASSIPPSFAWSTFGTPGQDVTVTFRVYDVLYDPGTTPAIGDSFAGTVSVIFSGAALSNSISADMTDVYQGQSVTLTTASTTAPVATFLNDSVTPIYSGPFSGLENPISWDSVNPMTETVMYVRIYATGYEGEINSSTEYDDQVIINFHISGAVGDSAVTDKGTPIDIDVLVNDTAGLVVAPQSGMYLTPSHGTAELLENGQIRYTPAEGWYGMDAFWYSVNDGEGTPKGDALVFVFTMPILPTVEPINVETYVGEPVDINLPEFVDSGDFVFSWASFTFLDGEGIPVSEITVDGVGTFVLSDNKETVTFTPDLAFKGVTPDVPFMMDIILPGLGDLTEVVVDGKVSVAKSLGPDLPQTSESTLGVTVKEKTAETPSGNGGSGGGGTGPADDDKPATTPAPTASNPATEPEDEENNAPPAKNPEKETVVTPGIVLPPLVEADKVPPRLVLNEPAGKISKAPKFYGETGKNNALVMQMLDSNVLYTVKIKVNGKYVELGKVQTDANGQVALPVFSAAKPGVYTIAVVNPTDGSVSYVKMVVKKAKNKK